MLYLVRSVCSRYIKSIYNIYTDANLFSFLLSSLFYSIVFLESAFRSYSDIFSIAYSTMKGISFWIGSLCLYYFSTIFAIKCYVSTFLCKMNSFFSELLDIHEISKISHRCKIKKVIEFVLVLLSVGEFLFFRVLRNILKSLQHRSSHHVLQ